MTCIDQVFGHFIQLVEVVAGEVEVFLLALFPFKAQPFDAVDDGVDVFLFFLGRIGVVEAQIAAAGVVAREAEVEADRFGMTNVQVTVGFRRETGDNSRQRLAVFAYTFVVFTGGEIGFDDAAQEVGRGRVGIGAAVF
ncbi:hypothetical protein D3C72_751150 [compost metagenome]